MLKLAQVGCTMDYHDLKKVSILVIIKALFPLTKIKSASQEKNHQIYKVFYLFIIYLFILLYIQVFLFFVEAVCLESVLRYMYSS